MKINIITKKIVEVRFKTQLELTKTFLRFQEYYESPNERFRGKAFTLGEYREWYAKENGAFTYYTDWSGMNIPYWVLLPFVYGKFDPLTPEERMLVDLFKDRINLINLIHIEPFCIIGTHEDSVDSLTHEIYHGLYYTNSDFKKEVNALLDDYDLQNLKAWLMKQGYCSKVLFDECQAYVGADWKWLMDEKGIKTPHSLHIKLRSLFEKHMKEKA